MKSRFPAGNSLRRGIFASVGGMVFAALDRFGYLLKNYGSIFAVSENPWHRNIWIRILLRFPTYALAVFALICLIEGCSVLEDGGGGTTSSRRGGGLVSWWERFCGWRHWFPVMWSVYFLSFLPAFLGGFPGLFAADAPNQVGWTFSGWLTAHHPLLHTGILCSIFSVCRGLGWSDDTAAAVYTVLQMAVLSGIFAGISRFLRKEEAPAWLQLGVVLYLCLFPFHGMMAIYTTKDTIFAGVLSLCLMQVYRMCACPQEYFQGLRHMVWGEVCFVLLLLFRNNGFHTMVLCAPFLLAFLRKYWKQLGGMLLILAVCSGIYNGPFLQAIGAEPGNQREALSVIMQTLGRTYLAGGDIRPEEMRAIRPVLDEEALSQYAPDLSDPIKNLFHTDAFEEDTAGFLKAWLSIGLRNKKIYLDAFLNTTLAFWYPGAENEYLEFVCFDIEEGNPNYPHVEMRPISQRLYRYYKAIGTDAAFRRLPILREFWSMGAYFWLLVFASLFLLYRKEYGRLLWVLPLWTYMGTSLFGPAALLRYAYPLMLAAPFLVFVMVRRE